MFHRHYTVYTAAALVLTLGLAHAAVARPELYEARLDIIAFGTNGPYTGQFTRHFHIPLGVVCNPYFPGGISCGPTTVENGTPLAGGGVASVFGSAPAAFTLPKNAIAGSFSGAFPTAYPTYLGSFVGGRLYNDAAVTASGGAGFFGAGAGAGSSSVRGAPASYGVARVVAGPNRFGGSMGLLGAVDWTRDLYLTPPVAGSVPLVTGFGELGIASVIGRSNANTARVQRFMLYYERGRYRSAVYSVVATGFRWTTGIAYAYDSAGRLASDFSLAGYDNRSPLGLGAIQLVTPFLAHWSMSPLPDHVAGIASLRVRFVPEPRTGLGLIVGAGLLQLVGRARTARAK